MLTTTLPPALEHDSIFEVPLLLPGWQLSLLETAANQSGISTGQMMRRLISEFFDKPEFGAAEDCGS
jgi:hypothetical protein